MQVLPANRLFLVNKPACPVCGAQLQVRILSIVPEDKGTRYIADHIDVQCNAAVPTHLSDMEVDRIHVRHADNGAAMRPIRDRLITWINNNYRFTPTT